MKQTVDFFKNKVAIVTGGGSGIGAALSHELCSRGATVIAFPFSVRLMWWLDRFNSSLLNPLHAKVLQNSRTLRSKQ